MDAFVPIISAAGAAVVQTKTALGVAFGADVDVNLDAPPSPGNLLVLCVVQDFDGPATYTMTNGPWSLVGSDDTFAGNGTNWPLRMYYRAVDVDTSDQTHVQGDSTVTDTGTIKVFMVELSGVDTLDAVVRTTNSSTTTATLTPTAGKVAALISATARRTTGTNVLTPASGMTEIAEIGPSPFAVNYRLIGATSGGYTVGSTGASANSAMKAAAFVDNAASGLFWVSAPDTIDDNDATSDDVDEFTLDDTSGAFWRGTLDGAELVTGINALIGFAGAGSVSVLLQGATLADYSDAETLAVLDITATGSLTADELDVAFDGQGPYEFVQLVLDSTAQDLRVYEIGVTVEPEGPPPSVPPGHAPSKAILEIYVHDEDASRWGTATWATGPATGTEGIWSGAGWQDVTPQGVNAHIIWGSRRPERGILAEQSGASWNVETYDPDRVLDPGNQDSPYFPQLVAGVPIRISHETLVIRTGYIDEIHYKHKDPDYRGQLLASDTIALMNQASVQDDTILDNFLGPRIGDVIEASGIAIGGIPLSRPSWTGPAIADWVEGDALDSTSVWDHIVKACQEVLYVPFIMADASLAVRDWGQPWDRGREISAPNLEDLEAVSHEDGLYSVVVVQVEDPDLDPIERVAAPLPRYGRRVWERTEPTIDPEGYAAAILSERSWPGVKYIPGAIHCFTKRDVNYFGSLLTMERVTITVPGVVSVTGRILGGELHVEHRQGAERGATWIFHYEVATDGSSAIGITTLVADGTGDTLVDDDTGTDYLEED